MGQAYRHIEAENESLRSFVTHRMLDLWQGVQLNGERMSGTMQNILATVSNDHECHMEFVRRQMDTRPYLGVPPAANPIRYPAPQFPPPSDPDFPPADVIAAAAAQPQSSSLVPDLEMDVPHSEGVSHPSSPSGGAPSPPILDGPPAACAPAESEQKDTATKMEVSLADCEDSAAGDAREEAAGMQGIKDLAGQEAQEQTAEDGTASAWKSGLKTAKRPQKDCKKTGPRPEKTRTGSPVFWFLRY